MSPESVELAINVFNASPVVAVLIFILWTSIQKKKESKGGDVVASAMTSISDTMAKVASTLETISQENRELLEIHKDPLQKPRLCDIAAQGPDTGRKLAEVPGMVKAVKRKVEESGKKLDAIGRKVGIETTA
jgi:hypothetical protein